jgi:hypothetical protein
VIADLDTLLIALYVELTDQIIPSLGLARSPAGISRSGCASRSTARQTAAIQTAPNRHPARHPPMAPRHPCQPKTVLRSLHEDEVGVVQQSEARGFAKSCTCRHTNPRANARS